ncbi:hypothetical protein GOODEAATRI_030189 [Goodea atripinnis]|uniref:Uncharacterized protein n=1 Tax=Goodea atripinnis TaxID=208336 RepID=A0ABV0P909_9TELE
MYYFFPYSILQASTSRQRTFLPDAFCVPYMACGKLQRNSHSFLFPSLSKRPDFGNTHLTVVLTTDSPTWDMDVRITIRSLAVSLIIALFIRPVSLMETPVFTSLSLTCLVCSFAFVMLSVHLIIFSGQPLRLSQE